MSEISAGTAPENLPLTDSTRGILCKPLFDQLPRGAALINVGRGGHLVQQDLLQALDQGQLSHAVLDVCEPEPLPPEHPLWSAPNLLVSPHVGGASSAMWPRARRLVRDQLHRYAAGEELVNVMSGPY